MLESLVKKLKQYGGFKGNKNRFTSNFKNTDATNKIKLTGLLRDKKLGYVV